MIAVFDIGGTTTRLGIADGETLVSTTAFPTQQNLEKQVVQLREALRSLTTESVANAIGGVAGRMNVDHTVLVRSRNLAQWEGAPISERLHKVFGAPVTIMNDAALAGLGEAVRGAGIGTAVVAYLTISTGVGGCRIANGRIEESADTFEPGTITIRDGLSLEDCIGGNALRARYGVAPEALKDPNAWAAVTVDLAHGLSFLIERWKPDIFVLGGGIVMHNAIDLGRVAAHVNELQNTFPKARIVKADLGDLAGLTGAALLGR